MKKFTILLTLVLVVLVSACSTESTVKDTVSSYLKKQLKNPESFKIELMEIRKDTIPAYLSNEMLTLAEKANDAFEEYNRYKDRSYLWADEKYQASQKMLSTTQELQTAYESAINEDSPTVEYIAYVKFSGTNAMGGTVSSRAIVIVDRNDPKKILGVFDIDKDFVEKFIVIKMVGSKFKFELKQNKFGKYETEGLPYFEQFIINEAE